VTWVDDDLTQSAGPGECAAIAQCSAHGRPVECTVRLDGNGRLAVTFATAQRRIAPGQTVALYDPANPDAVIGSGIAA